MHFKQTQMSLSLFVYVHLWVTVYLPRACNSMLFPFSSLSEHQEHPFTSFSVCLFCLSTLNPISQWGGKGGWGSSGVPGHPALPFPPAEPHQCLLALSPQSSPGPWCLLNRLGSSDFCWILHLTRPYPLHCRVSSFQQVCSYIRKKNVRKYPSMGTVLFKKFWQKILIMSELYVIFNDFFFSQKWNKKVQVWIRAQYFNDL